MKGEVARGDRHCSKGKIIGVYDASAVYIDEEVIMGEEIRSYERDGYVCNDEIPWVGLVGD